MLGMCASWAVPGLSPRRVLAVEQGTLFGWYAVLSFRPADGPEVWTVKKHRSLVSREVSGVGRELLEQDLAVQEVSAEGH